MTEPTTEPCGNGQYATQARLAEAYRITIHQQREITQLRHTLEQIKHLAYQGGQPHGHIRRQIIGIFEQQKETDQ